MNHIQTEHIDKEIEELILLRDIALQEHGPSGRSTRIIQDALASYTASVAGEPAACEEDEEDLLEAA